MPTEYLLVCSLSQAPSAEEIEKAKAISKAAASYLQASRVKIGSVLSIALSPARVCGATVMSIVVSSLSEIQVTVKWDDGDELFGNKLVLFGLQVLRYTAAAAALPAYPNSNPISN